jgi:tetratricopeptide (TPR) repeat protein
LPALNDPLVWIYLGFEAAKAQAWALAVSALREAVRLKPDLAEAWYNLGIAYRQQGDRSRLLEVYQQLRILNPTLADEFFRKVVRP